MPLVIGGNPRRTTTAQPEASRSAPRQSAPDQCQHRRASTSSVLTRGCWGGKGGCVVGDFVRAWATHGAIRHLTRRSRPARRGPIGSIGCCRRAPSRSPSRCRSAIARDELVEAIRDHQVVVVAGETGSGKSTQLPKLCLAAGRGIDGMIGHTQPRRVAARTVAERVADELGTSVGDAIGYSVRFSDRVTDATLVRVMTDGILLNELQRDRDLRRYDTLIIDEAHERSLNIDFLLGYVKQLLPRRPELRVIITSATIDNRALRRALRTRRRLAGTGVRRRGPDVPGRGAATARTEPTTPRTPTIVATRFGP